MSEYVIVWRSSITGDVGRSRTTFPKDQAERIARVSNEDAPDILTYWAEPAQQST